MMYRLQNMILKQYKIKTEVSKAIVKAKNKLIKTMNKFSIYK